MGTEEMFGVIEECGPKQVKCEVLVTEEESSSIIGIV